MKPGTHTHTIIKTLLEKIHENKCKKFPHQYFDGLIKVVGSLKTNIPPGHHFWPIMSTCFDDPIRYDFFKNDFPFCLMSLSTSIFITI